MQNAEKMPSLQSNAKIGILLNGNARRVTRSLVEPLKSLLAPEDICFSQSLKEANDFLHHIVGKRYDVLLVCGGDGTLQETISALHRVAEQEGQESHLPAVGVLPLGTGNAISRLVGGTRNPAEMVKLMQTHSEHVHLQKFRWVKHNNLLSPFAGIGFDSLLLHYYRILHNKTRNTFFARLGKGLIGYLIALVFMAIPKQLFTPRAEIEVINEGEGWELDMHGNRVRKLEEGEVLYKGKPLLTGVASIPCYGYGVKVFPFCEAGRQMQLRVAAISTLTAVFNIPAIWKGTYRNAKIRDFHVESIRIRSDREVPVQVGGDSVGLTTDFRLTFSEQETTMVDLQAAKALTS